jgi:hypothetical protein
MKNIKNCILIAFFAVALFIPPAYAFAATPTIEPVKNSTSSDTLKDKLKQIEILKDKIATKVAEIREKDKTAVYGKVKTIENDHLILTAGKTDYSITFAEDTIVYNFPEGVKTQTDLKKIKADNILTVFGYLSDKKENISAKYIYIEKPKINIVGIIKDKNAENFTLTVTSKDGEKTIDIEKTTKTYVFDKTKKIFLKAGFTQLTKDDRVHILGTTGNNDNTVSAEKIYSLNTKQLINTPNPSITPTASPTPTPLNQKKKETEPSI